MERHAALTRPHYKDSHGVLIVYSTADKSSFDEVPRYIEEARGYEPGVPLFLIRNKIDLEVLEESIVSQEQENDQYLGSTKLKLECGSRQNRRRNWRLSQQTGKGLVAEGIGPNVGLLYN